MALQNFVPVSPTSELEAVNIMLSTIGETPINSFEEVTSDVAIARNTLTEVSKATQLEGWSWNMEDNVVLKPDLKTGYIRVNPDVVRVHFPEPQESMYTIRGGYLYDLVNHTKVFASDFTLTVSVTVFLNFNDLPESCRRYVIIRASRVFQERVVGSDTLSKFTATDEARARAVMLGEERRTDRPNLLKGTLPPTGTYNPVTAIMNRGGGWRHGW